MSCSIKFVRLEDFISDIDSIDLSTGGYSLEADGYFPTVAPIGAKSVNEVIVIKLQGTSKDDLAALTQDINDKIRQIQWWMESPSVERYQVWMRVQLENETYPRQAMLLKIVPPDKLKVYTPMEIRSNYIGEFQIGIERTPYWEDVYPYPTPAASVTVNGDGMTSTQITDSIGGDVPARLASFSINSITEAGVSTKAWFGFKSDRYGNPANFKPYWPLVASYSLGTDTTQSNDGFGNGIIVCTFATDATLVKRSQMQVNDVAPSNPNDQRGLYTVLLRARVGTGTVAYARIRYAMGIAAVAYNAAFRGLQPITSDVWEVYEMGTVSIPAQRAITTDSLINFTIQLDVRRVSGTGYFYAYGYTLIPMESMIKIDSPDPVNYNINNPVTIYKRADDVITSYDYVAGLPGASFVVKDPSQKWGIPCQSSSLYLVGAVNNLGNPIGYFGSSLNVSYKYIPRWRTLRGSDT